MFSDGALGLNTTSLNANRGRHPSSSLRAKSLRAQNTFGVTPETWLAKISADVLGPIRLAIRTFFIIIVDGKKRLLVGRFHVKRCWLRSISSIYECFKSMIASDRQF